MASPTAVLASPAKQPATRAPVVAGPEILSLIDDALELLDMKSGGRLETIYKQVPGPPRLYAAPPYCVELALPRNSRACMMEPGELLERLDRLARPQPVDPEWRRQQVAWLLDPAKPSLYGASEPAAPTPAPRGGQPKPNKKKGKK